MGAINTQVVDLTLIVLSLIFGAFYARSVFKSQKTSVKIIPLFIIWAAGLWCLLNWVGHLAAIFYVNLQPMLSGSFTYTFHFYSVMFLGVVFMLLSLLQLEILKKMSQLRPGQYKFLKQVSGLIILFSLPITPLNPIGALPVISSLLILTTVAVTKRSWGLATTSNETPVNTPQAG